MNKEDKRVLRRKRYTIASHFTLTDELLEELSSLHLINPHGRDQVKHESGNMHRVDRWLELLPQLDRKQTMSALCDFLEQHHDWLADDLRTELKAEKAGTSLRLDETIRRESEALVQRDFGNSRRLSEFDKKDIKKLLGTRMQCMKDVWKKQCQRVECKLKDETNLKAFYKNRSLELISSINGFIRINKGNLRGSTKFSDDKVDKESSVDESSDDHAVVIQLSTAVRELMEVSSQGFLELDQLREEKRKSMAVISAQDENVKLNVVLEQAMEKIEKEMKDLKNDVSKRDTRLEALKVEMKMKESRALEDDHTHNREIRNLKRHLNAAHEKVRDLEITIGRLERELCDTKGELERTRSKSELLEKSRRLGFLSEASKPEDPVKNGRRPGSRPLTYRWKTLRSPKTKLV